MEKKLEVKNLVISFRTSNGKVQAVRNISFDLAKGETLAIVGESGSGKSVTSKAILGILAGNSIIEGGEIVYDGKDLLKITEEDFHRIRGDKIAMIFQDPMSSLNPIVKIGRQLTEAMILKNKARRKECRRNFNSYLKMLEENMIESSAKSDAAKAAALKQKCKDFNKFEYKHIELEENYNKARESAEEAVSELENLVFELGKKFDKDVKVRVQDVAKLAKGACHKYLVSKDGARMVSLADSLPSLVASEKDSKDYKKTVAAMEEMLPILKAALALAQPNFFALGYYETFAGKAVPDKPVPELNAYMRKYLDDNFMLAFIDDAKKALIYSAEKANLAKEKAVKFLESKRAVFERENLDKKECDEACKLCAKEVFGTIDHMEIRKDSLVYTFGSGLRSEINKYFDGIRKNEKEKNRYAKQKAKYDALVEKGKEPDWQVVPASYTDLELAKQNILMQVDRLISHYKEILSAKEKRDFAAETVNVIDYLKENASGVVQKVTKRLAKEKAVKLMEEVGIPEPRTRYNQYPFEFSGGMRQRIVIAIALAANPDILICDEPTTALDVTIQAQILELINRLKKERNISVIFITHDLGVVANMADRVAVMYAGKIVEYGTAQDIFYEAAHPYTWALLSSMPDLDTTEKLDAIPGTPPNMIFPPKGDAFAARNKYALKIDFEKEPPMFGISDTHYAATWLLHPDAPKVAPPKIVTTRIERMKNRREAEDGR